MLKTSFNQKRERNSWTYSWSSLTRWDGHVGIQNNSKMSLKFCIIIESNSQIPFFIIRDLTQQDGWRTQAGRMTKNCRARLCIPGLALEFFVILSSWAFQPSCCLRSQLFCTLTRPAWRHEKYHQCKSRHCQILTFDWFHDLQLLRCSEGTSNVR